MAEPSQAADLPRSAQLTRGLNLEYLTIAWNAVEALVAIVAGLAAGSIALVGFGLDSVVEGTSGGVLVWRLRAERDGARDPDQVAQLEARAQRLVALTLFALAAYVAIESGRRLWLGQEPSPSVVGIVLASLSLAVMWWLAREKHDVADVLGSRAMEADAFQTDACFWLSLILLVGTGLNVALDWWWADPLAAIGMAAFIVDEGREIWGEDSG